MDEIKFIHDSFLKDENSLKNHDFVELPDIFIVEDDQVLGKAIKKFLEKKLNLKVNYFNSPSECINSLSSNIEGRGRVKPYCLITDISFDDSGADGLLLIDILKEKGHKFVSIAMTGFASVETAIKATKKGVFQYLTKPFKLSDLSNLVVEAIVTKLNVSEDNIFSDHRKINLKVKNFISNQYQVEIPKNEDVFYGMIGRSRGMKDVFERIKKVAASDSTVLITGESGTGKELVAKAIHEQSNRNSQKMISVNCGAIPGELLESELFGHIKGSFTGAISNRKGRFELANSGTIFLDEIGDMPLLLQVKILRALQNREVEPIGSSKTINVDVRIITATHKELEKAVFNGEFREDLYYRLNVIPLKIPPLRDRREDIPLLISYFLSKFVSADGRNKIEFVSESLELLMGYHWPGNVRELENLIERLVILKGGSIVKVSDLPAKFFQTAPFSTKNCRQLINLPEKGIDLKETISQIEESLIVQALKITNGNKNQASKLLHMNRTTLIEKMKKKNLIIPDNDYFN